ncbi:unnamed protein product, partial [Ixodes hexagonus]
GAWSEGGDQTYSCQQRVAANMNISKATTIYLPWDEFDVDRISYFDTYSSAQLDHGTLLGFEDGSLRNETTWTGTADIAGHKATHNLTIDKLTVSFRAFVRHSKLPYLRLTSTVLGMAWTDKYTLTATVKKFAAQVEVRVIHGDECSLTFRIWNMETEVSMNPKMSLGKERQEKFEEKLKSRIQESLRRTIETMYRKALWRP